MVPSSGVGHRNTIDIERAAVTTAQVANQARRKYRNYVIQAREITALGADPSELPTEIRFLFFYVSTTPQ